MVAEEQKRELLEFAVQMARRVGAIHLEWFRRSDLEIGTKSNEFDVVTRGPTARARPALRAWCRALPFAGPAG